MIASPDALETTMRAMAIARTSRVRPQNNVEIVAGSKSFQKEAKVASVSIWRNAGGRKNQERLRGGTSIPRSSASTPILGSRAWPLTRAARKPRADVTGIVRETILGILLSMITNRETL